MCVYSLVWTSNHPESETPYNGFSFASGTWLAIYIITWRKERINSRVQKPTLPSSANRACYQKISYDIG